MCVTNVVPDQYSLQAGTVVNHFVFSKIDTGCSEDDQLALNLVMLPHWLKLVLYTLYWLKYTDSSREP
uniref:Uncharacterized protein n=1 Tax=Pararge aegeria TaxID=116150 RepID=S4PWQ2_9NEOP